MPASSAYWWPRQVSPFVGRGPLRQRLASLVRDHPVVGVVGILGVGKTELVLRAVEDAGRAGGVPDPAYASLADARTARQVVQRTARALRLTQADAGTGPLESLLDLLAARSATLVWDDAQDGDAAAIAALVRGLWRWPGAWRLVVVSRGPLPLGERALDVPTVDVPLLDDEECAALLAALPAAALPLAEAQVLCREGGNPLLLRLAAAGDQARGRTAALERQVERAARGTARRLLMLLLASRAPLSTTEVATLCGRGAPAAVAALERHLLVLQRGGTVALNPTVAQLVRTALGEPGPAAWRLLLPVSRRRLQRAPGDPDALLLAARVLLRGGSATTALGLLKRHVDARRSAPLDEITALVAELATADAACAFEGALLVASQQLGCGDTEAARRTLAGLPPAPKRRPRLARHYHLLRAAVLIQQGEVALAERELVAAAPRAADLDQDPLLGITAAELGVLRGDLEPARRRLLALAGKARLPEQLERRRTVALTISYLLEQRLDLAAAWARRARRAAREQMDASEALAWCAEVLARLGLDQIDEATAVAADAARRCEGAAPELRALSGLIKLLLDHCVAWRRGEFRQNLELGQSGLPLLAQMGKAVVTVAAHFLAVAALGLGRYSDAEALLRTVSGTLDQAGLSGLWAVWQIDWALLAQARGDERTAQESVARARRLGPRNPYARVEAWALGLESVPAPPGPAYPPSVRAYARLRQAERALGQAALDEAEVAAREAAAWYRQAGVRYELARALLARGEALLRREEPAPARREIAAARELAAAQGYAPLLVHAELVRAAAADGDGQVHELLAALVRARRAATGELWDAALRASCARAGLAGLPAAGERDLWRPVVARLGLDRPVSWLWVTAETVRLRAERGAPGSALVVDMAAGTATVGDAQVDLARQPLLLRLLEYLALTDGSGASTEGLYTHAWGSDEYHALRNRNCVYVAVGRLRTALGPVLGRAPITTSGEGRYHLTQGPRAAVVYPAGPPGDAAARAERVRQQLGAGPLPAAADYGRRWGLPLGHARWELAIGAATREPAPR